MSSPSDKPLDAPSPQPGPALATLAQLRQMRSAALKEEGDTVRRTSVLGSHEVWKRVGGSGSNAVYQLVEG